MKQLPSIIPEPISETSFSIPTYIINLKKRADRKAHVLEQFQGRDEFSLTIVEAFEHSFGALGLWATIRYILHDLTPDEAEYIIICEDDIEFTKDYSKEYLFGAIDQAKDKNADILLGGVSWFGDLIHISDRMFWTNNFSGLHFTIIFKKFYRNILENKLKYYNAADYYLAALTNNVLLLYPFLAIQKEFGYSDATTKNNIEGRVKSLFEITIGRFAVLNKINSVYKNLAKDTDENSIDEDYDKIVIPTYIINLPQRTERLKHIKQQFVGKTEFDVQIVAACKHEVGALGLWLSIRKIIELAIANDDDVIVICEDDHQFTEHYDKKYLIKNIIDAHEEGASFLSGGTSKFRDAIPITKNRYWVTHCLSTQFVVVYKKFFQEILDHPYDEKIVADLAYSDIALNKMVLYPFISTQKDFGYSDITAIHTEVKNLVTNMFMQSDRQFKQIQQAYLKYHPEDNTIKSIEKYA